MSTTGVPPRADAPAAELPTVVVVGRPNVGKSTLVNRITGRRAAVVDAQPGVTRDYKTMVAEWSGRRFQVVDTGGWLKGGDDLASKVSLKTQRALELASVVLFVTDVTVGTTQEDLETASMLRSIGAPVILVANKVDDERREAVAWELLSLGFGEPWAVSALHGRRSGDLLDEVVALLPEPVQPVGSLQGGGDAPRVALVGRPNAGKSTLFNRLVGDERAIVSDVPGTTRDTLDTVVETEAGVFCFVDTAGMRRPSRADAGPERYSVLRALDALDASDVALLVLDASDGVTRQDQRLAERIATGGSAAVVILNKWDLIEPALREEVLAETLDRLAFVSGAPIVRACALSGRNVSKILPALARAIEAYTLRVSTGALNRALADIQKRHPAPRGRIRYGVQGAADPPTFTLFATARLRRDYLAYVENQLRERFGLAATAIKIRVRLEGR
ncbi:MAG: ribosome biogenesis GTPase Der [Acidimicrobiales bacterium]